MTRPVSHMHQRAARHPPLPCGARAAITAARAPRAPPPLARVRDWSRCTPRADSHTFLLQAMLSKLLLRY